MYSTIETLPNPPIYVEDYADSQFPMIVCLDGNPESIAIATKGTLGEISLVYVYNHSSSKTIGSLVLPIPKRWTKFTGSVTLRN